MAGNGAGSATHEAPRCRLGIAAAKRIAALTTSQITIRDDTVPVRFGDHTFPSPSRSLTGREGTSTVVIVSIDR